jgi:hypothetical protein
MVEWWRDSLGPSGRLLPKHSVFARMSAGAGVTRRASGATERPTMWCFGVAGSRSTSE